MTDKEALKEAQRRWGRKAVVIHWRKDPPWIKPFSVGIRKRLFENEMLGQGDSWEEAFENAQKRRREPLRDPKQSASEAAHS